MTAAAAATLRQTRITILLSINAAAILIAGVLIATAISGKGLELRAVNEHSDEVEGNLEEVELLASVSESTEGKTVTSADGTVYKVAANGWISSEQLIKLAEPFMKTDYGKFLKRLADGEV